MSVIRRQQPSENNESLIERLADEYAKAKAFAESAQERADSLKRSLTEQVQENGIADEKGSLWLPAGKYELKRERRVSTTLNQKRAEEWAKENGFWESVSETVEVISEDKITTLLWERKDLSDQIRDLYTEKEIWAFKLVEKK